MAIGVSSSIHAAFTLFVQQPPQTKALAFAQNRVFYQAPAGGILKCVPIKDDGVVIAHGWVALLDRSLIPSSTGFAAVPFTSLERTSLEPELVITVLFHIDPRVKVFVSVKPYVEDGVLRWRPVDQSLHVHFLNFQTNKQELLPIEDTEVPGLFPTPTTPPPVTPE